MVKAIKRFIWYIKNADFINFIYLFRVFGMADKNLARVLLF